MGRDSLGHWKVVLKNYAKNCAEGCNGENHLVHIGINWQNEFKCPFWPSD